MKSEGSLRDVRVSTEQKALREAAAHVADQLGPYAVGQLDDHVRKLKLDNAVVESGWREMRTPDDDGRPRASAVEVSLVAEELGRRSADTAFIGPTLAAELRRLAGAPVASDPEVGTGDRTGNEWLPRRVRAAARRRC